MKKSFKVQNEQKNIIEKRMQEIESWTKGKKASEGSIAKGIREKYLFGGGGE